MDLQIHSYGGRRIAEGRAGLTLLPSARDVSDLIEHCFNHATRLVLLDAGNLGEDFFDLKSGMAGVVLEKCRQYRLRLAVVLPPEQELSARFRELVAEENKRPYVRFCATAQEGRDWLVAQGPEPAASHRPLA